MRVILLIRRTAAPYRRHALGEPLGIADRRKPMGAHRRLRVSSAVSRGGPFQKWDLAGKGDLRAAFGLPAAVTALGAA